MREPLRQKCGKVGGVVSDCCCKRLPQIWLLKMLSLNKTEKNKKQMYYLPVWETKRSKMGLMGLKFTELKSVCRQGCALVEAERIHSFLLQLLEVTCIPGSRPLPAIASPRPLLPSPISSHSAPPAPSSKGPCGYTGPPQIIQHILPISRSLITFASPLFHVR